MSISPEAEAVFAAAVVAFGGLRTIDARDAAANLFGYLVVKTAKDLGKGKLGADLQLDIWASQARDFINENWESLS